MSAPPRWARTVALLVLPPTLLCGCSMAPRARLTQIEGQYATLQAETSKLKDESLALRGRNRELTQRAVEDARRMADLEDANERLTRSIAAYQKERDAMVDSFERIKQSVQLASNGSTTAMLDRFESFARSHPGCVYDPGRSVWSFPADQLFKPGGDAWQPNALLLVDAFARLLQEANAPVEPTRLTAVEAPAEIQQVSLGTQSKGVNLAQRRAVKLSERLSSRPSGASPPIPVDVRESSGGTATIEIQLTRIPVGSGS